VKEKGQRPGRKEREGGLSASEQKSCVRACIQIETKGVNLGSKDERLGRQADISQKISSNSIKHP
jgi:hypothetical protein